MPGSAERWIWRGGAGRPLNACTIGTFVTARAGRDDAKYAATTARTMDRMTTSHGRANTPTRWWALASKLGRYANHATKPTMKPRIALATPTTVPLALTTRRT